MNTESELTPGEACHIHTLNSQEGLTQEDFARMCNTDGSLKSQSHTTTFSLKSNPSKTITVNSTVLCISSGLFIAILIGVIVLIVRGHNQKKRR